MEVEKNMGSNILMHLYILIFFIVKLLALYSLCFTHYAGHFKTIIASNAQTSFYLGFFSLFMHIEWAMSHEAADNNGMN